MKQIYKLKTSQKIKIILAMMCIGISIILIKKNNTNMGIAKIVNENTNLTTIKLQKGGYVYLKENSENNNQEKTEANLTNTQNTNLKQLISQSDKNELVNLNTEDKAVPNNITSINTKILEDAMIINFKTPMDNGTNYEYIITNDSEEKSMNFYSESGIYGYNYIINNTEETEAGYSANKIDDSPIVLQDIIWSKDYYLHIRTIDNNQNCSESKTFKLDLPSNGVDLKYIDKNTKNEITCEEKISGSVNEDYDVSKMSKEIDGYVLVSNDGELVGKLKRERLNIQYIYAKKANLHVKYVDKESGKEILARCDISGYEGKEIQISSKKIKNYAYDSGEIYGKMQDGETTVNIYYNYTPEEDKSEKEDADENKSNEKFKKIQIKYVDFDTDQILYKEELISNENNKVKFKLKEIEGYKLMSNLYFNENDNSGNNKDMNKGVYNYKNNIQDNIENDNLNIIDELIQSLDKEELIVEDKDKVCESANNDIIKSQYEIVINCDDSDYIIYYKR